MKTFSKKSTSKDMPKRNHHGINNKQTPVNRSVPAFSGSIAIQRKSLCPCDGGCPRCSGMIQPKLTMGQPDDKYEEEADRVADQVMRMPDSAIQRKAGCLSCGDLNEEQIQTKPIGDRITPLVQRQVEEEEEEPVQAKEMSNKSPLVTEGIENRIQMLNGGGQPLSVESRAFFEPRFDRDFSNVRVHTDARAADAAKSLNARAFTKGNNIVFARGQYSPATFSGKHLLAHELKHVVQQGGRSGGSVPSIQGERGRRRRHRGPAMQLENRPSPLDPPCACLVFVHNNEQNARWAAETLHSRCRYNMAIIQQGTGRRIPIPGTTRSVDPNELFPQNIQTECTADEAACRAYIAGHNNLRAMQMQFFLAIKTCSANFALPTIALHNNAISDTAAFRRAVPGLGHMIAVLMEDIDRETQEGRGSRANLRQRLAGLRRLTGRNFTGLMTARRTTNIFRWCNLPEITRCSIGAPWEPDNVIWVTNPRDFDRLRQHLVNVVLQESGGSTTGSESDTDLSTLFARMGSGVRYINIETPITPGDQTTRDTQLDYIQENLTRLGLNCCDVPQPPAPETEQEEE